LMIEAQADVVRKWKEYERFAAYEPEKL